MLLGLRTVICHVENLGEAKQWYTRFTGVEPYFDMPFYVGGSELGLDPDMSGVTHGSNSVAYWGVDNVQEAFAAALSIGGVAESEIQDVGDGIKVAKVRDPFGNVIGLIENPNFGK